MDTSNPLSVPSKDDELLETGGYEFTSTYLANIRLETYIMFGTNARKVEGKVLWDLGAEQCITSRVCAKWYGVMSSI